MSDHSPIILDTGDSNISGSMFKFESSWFLIEDLDNIVRQVWNDHYVGSSIEKWQNKLRALRKKLKG